MQSPQKFTNWRRNPFTNVLNPASLTEEHTVKYLPEPNLYGIQATEGIVLENPSTLAVEYKDGEALTPLEEVPKTQPPSAGQFRADYDAETFFSTSLIELNPADNGKTLKVTYKGTGSIVKSDYTFNQLSSIPTELEVRGTNILNALCPVCTIIPYCPGYFTNTRNANFRVEGPDDNTIEAVNEFLPDHFRVADGTAPNDPESPVYNTPTRYLPYTPDYMSLIASGSAGSIIGRNSVLLNQRHIPPHRHRVDVDPPDPGNHGHHYREHHSGQIRLKSNSGGTWYGAPWAPDNRRYSENTWISVGSAAFNTRWFGGNNNGHSSNNAGGQQSVDIRQKSISVFAIVRIK